MDVGRLSLMDVLHVVSKPTMADTMLLENVGDILGVCDKGPRSQRGSLWCVNPQIIDER